ncbi:hypothetical protein CORC01_02635 [Colletotrichum orchidophilum]|uniref:Uncharacterized protein n=1 Tax=Colletotrichum orchidophilum TaxID=1209926 RepID=A0A1G4BL77_9PEZI|nr:uncharacterized protein CORC01_02635 [Colletotrichum orchidophilum]OHF02056.1 hypothetical protein CORC01_02635 [Colletotrichum orchidophilum]
MDGESLSPDMLSTGFLASRPAPTTIETFSSSSPIHAYGVKASIAVRESVDGVFETPTPTSSYNDHDYKTQKYLGAALVTPATASEEPAGGLVVHGGLLFPFAREPRRRKQGRGPSGAVENQQLGSLF